MSYAPVFLELVCDQVINGCIWNETYADPEAASVFVLMVEDRLDATLQEGIVRCLQPIGTLEYEEGKVYL